MPCCWSASLCPHGGRWCQVWGLYSHHGGIILLFKAEIWTSFLSVDCFSHWRCHTRFLMYIFSLFLKKCHAFLNWNGWHTTWCASYFFETFVAMGRKWGFFFWLHCLYTHFGVHWFCRFEPEMGPGVVAAIQFDNTGLFKNGVGWLVWAGGGGVSIGDFCLFWDRKSLCNR